MNGETPSINNQTPSPTGWESLQDDFAGERNINDKTGKARTFAEWDLYPKMPGETSRAYGKRLKKMHEMTAEYEAAEQAKAEAEAAAALAITDDKGLRTDNYLNSEQGKQELAAEARFDEITAKIERAVDEGKFSKEHADALLAQQLERYDHEIAGIRQDFTERRSTVGDPEDETRYAAWSKKADAENLARHETEEDARLEAEAAELSGAELSDEERARLEENEREAEELIAKRAAINQELTDLDDADLDGDVDKPSPESDDELRARLEAEERAYLEAEERARLEAEAKARLEAEAAELSGAELSNEERARLEENEREAEELIAKRAAINQELAELDDDIDLDDGPLTAINADFTHDKHELARDLAERDLRISKENFIKRLWKGTLFKKVYQKKYEKEYLDGTRTVEVDGEQRTVYEIVAGRSDAAIKRFVLGATEDARFIHKNIGQNGDGEKLVEADEKTQAGIRSAIEKFASAKIPEGGSLADLERVLREDIGRVEAFARDRGDAVDGDTINNYLDVALQARKRIEHGLAMENVMEGFKVYNADVRDGVRTQAHRDNIDKVTNWLENRVGQFVPAEILAGVVSVTSGLAQVGTRVALGAAGGIAASAAISGLKERNRITEDRTRVLRDLANGEVYGQLTDADINRLHGKDKRRAKRAQKYETQIGGTLYELRSAKSLTAGIETAMAMDAGEARDEALLRAIAEARVRVDFSDSQEKDLISFSSADRRGDERLALDIALIRAEKSLSEEKRSQVSLMRGEIRRQLSRDVDKSDKDFARTRAVLAAKKAGKTLALGTALFFASQEAVAAVDPNKIGIFEKAGLLKTANADDASETLLASGFGAVRGRFNQVVSQTTDTTRTIQVNGDNQVAIDQYEQAGWSKTEISPAYTEESGTIIREVSVGDSTANIDVAYDGWANNGTSVSDGNELRAYLTDGKFVSGMRGASTMGNQSFDYDSLAAAGRVKGFLTVGGSKFEVASSVNEAGQLTWGEGNIFTILNPDGTTSTIQAVGDNGEKLYQYFEIAVDNGVDADGIRHIIPLATDMGSNSFNGTVIQEVPNIIEHPAVYEFSKTFTEVTDQTVERLRDITANGLAFAPETARTGLSDETRSAEMAA